MALPIFSNLCRLEIVKSGVNNNEGQYHHLCNGFFALIDYVKAVDFDLEDRLHKIEQDLRWYSVLNPVLHNPSDCKHYCINASLFVVKNMRVVVGGSKSSQSGFVGGEFNKCKTF